MKIGFIGAGNVARALGKLLTAAGHSVLFGVREGSRSSAQDVVSFADAARADLVVLAVPFAATRDLLPSLALDLTGKIVVDATNPMNPDWSPMLLGQENSCANGDAQIRYAQADSDKHGRRRFSMEAQRPRRSRLFESKALRLDSDWARQRLIADYPHLRFGFAGR